MGDCFVCSLCGISRYRHDVATFPHNLPPKAVEEWKEAVGERVFQRACRQANPTVCVEHFANVEFDVHSNELYLSQPRKMTDEERMFIHNYFNDHNYSSLTECHSVSDISSKCFFCSVCSDKVLIDSLIQHAAGHIRMHLETLIEPCPLHKLYSRLGKINLQCSRCILSQKKNFVTIKNQAQICFPHLTFKYVHYSCGRDFNLKIIANVNAEYLKSRPHLRHSEGWEVTLSDIHDCKKPSKLMKRKADQSESNRDTNYMQHTLSPVVPKCSNRGKCIPGTAWCPLDNHSETTNPVLKLFSQADLVKKQSDFFSKLKAARRKREEERRLLEAIPSPRVEVDDFDPFDSLSHWVEQESATELQGAHAKKVEVDPAAKSEMNWISTASGIHTALVDHFRINMHPSPLELIGIANLFSTSYKKIVLLFTKLRISNNVQCAPRDNCERIKQYFEYESYNAYNRMNYDDAWRLLDEELNNRYGTVITIGHIHLLADMTGLDPMAIKTRIRSFIPTGATL